jgi:hypothetical protein
MRTFLFLIAPIYIIFPIIASLLSIKHWKSSDRLLFIYLLLASIFNLIAVITSYYSINNLVFLNIYTVLEFGVISRYLNTLVENKSLQSVVKWSSMGMITAHIGILSYLNAWMIHNNISRFVECMLLMMLLVYILFQEFSKQVIKRSRIFILFSFLFYFSCASCLFIVSNIKDVDHFYLMLLWVIHGGLLILLYTLIALGFLNLNKRNESYN